MAYAYAGVYTAKTGSRFLKNCGTESVVNWSKHEQYWFGIKEVDKYER